MYLWLAVGLVKPLPEHVACERSRDDNQQIFLKTALPKPRSRGESEQPLLPRTVHFPCHKQGHYNRNQRHAPHRLIDGQQEKYGACDDRVCQNQDNDVALLKAEHFAPDVRLQQHPRNGHDISASIDNSIVATRQPERVAHKQNKQQGKGHQRHNVVLCLCLVPHHKGEHVINKDGKECQFQPSDDAFPAQLPTRCSLFHLPPERQRYGRPHGKQEKRENKVYPCNAIDVRIKGVFGWRHLRMIHPGRKNAEGFCG